MAAASVAFNGIVPEVLTDDNYENWSDFVKGYLMGKGLWNVVTSSVLKSGDEDWKMKNAKALHAIKLSCGSKALAHIKKCVTAKEAWNQLSLSFSSYTKSVRDIELGILHDNVLGNDNIVQLRRHVNAGNWEAASLCIGKDLDVVSSTCSLGRTVLHIAVITGHEEILEKLIDLFKGKEEEKEKLLKIEENCGYTALALAARLTDNSRIAMCMVEECKDLLTMKSRDDEIPVLLASANGQKDMTRYLYSETPWDKFPEEQVARYSGLLLTRCISAEIFDVALTLLQQNPSIPLTHESENLRPLYVLAQMPHVFPSGRQHQHQHQLEPHILQPITDILKLLVRRMKRNVELNEERRLIAEILMHLEKRISKFNESDLKCSSAYDAMLLAAKHGIIELIDSLSKANPDLLWAIDKNKRGAISYAILNRQPDVLDNIHKSHEEKIQMISFREDEFGNNMLHLAAEPSAPYLLLGGNSSPLQLLQREIQFFNKVEGMVHPKCKEAKNAYGKKPREVFGESHEELAQASEKWANGVATSVSLVGTLIATITFAAVFTVPGGFDQQTGLPILLHNKLFKFFIIADTVALFTSAASVLVLARVPSTRNTTSYILTLSSELRLGFYMLFCSVMFMAIAFCVALALMLHKNWTILSIAVYIAYFFLALIAGLKLNAIGTILYALEGGGVGGVVLQLQSEI